MRGARSLRLAGISTLSILVGLLLLAPSVAGAQGIPERPVFQQFQAHVVPSSKADRARPDASRAGPAPSSIQDEPDEPSLWRHLTIGAGIGAVMGFVLGWGDDSQQDPPDSGDDFWNFQSDYYYRITGTLIGGAAGASFGGILYAVRR